MQSHIASAGPPRFMCGSAGKPNTMEEVPVALPAGVEAIIGGPSESCTAVCAKSQRACSGAHFAALNSCNKLRQHFPCEAGCGLKYDSDSNPGYTISTADKGEQPTFCWVSPPSITVKASKASTCESSTPSFQRLCPCAGSLHVPGQIPEQDSATAPELDLKPASRTETKIME